MSWKNAILHKEPQEGDIYRINPDSNKDSWDDVNVPDEDERFKLGLADDDMYNDCKWMFDGHWYMSTKFLKKHFIRVE